MNRLVLFLIGIVLVGIAGFALVWFGVGRELGPATAGILVDLRDGKYRAVHERAHESFRERVSVADLTAYWEWWREEMGTFVEILSRRGVSTSSQDGEVHKGITVEAGFMKGRALVRFEFLTLKEGPALAHFRLARLDEGRGSADDRDELVARVRRLFDLYDKQDWTALYAALSFDLQKAWPQKIIAKQMPMRRKAYGKVTDLRLVKTEEGPDEIVEQYFDVDYEKASGKAKVTQQFDDGRWHVVGFVVGDAH